MLLGSHAFIIPGEQFGTALGTPHFLKVSSCSPSGYVVPDLGTDLGTPTEIINKCMQIVYELT